MTEDKPKPAYLYIPQVYEQQIKDQLASWGGINHFMGLPEPSEERKEAYRQRCIKAVKAMHQYNELAPRIRSRALRDIAELHKPVNITEGWTHANCLGCDAQGYEVDNTEWPCRTAMIMLEFLNLDTEPWE